ncbi:MAG: aldo/keto reductase [Candidatus Omnitrophica bacterium]|nr:aldo/keto reductase [Candidatus Omnitrophota bacterium]
MNLAKLPKRLFRDEVELSLIGFGGIVVTDAEQDQANRVVAKAIEKGVNYFDVAPSYGDAQQKLGPALKPYRDDCFLACKTTERTAEGAKREFEESLEILQTDHFDLYQLHSILDVDDDVEACFARDGAMRFLIQAKREGRIRYLGFSAHSSEAALAAMGSYDFDSVLFPLNFCSAHRAGFGPRILEEARTRGMARLALKGMARQKWPEEASEADKDPWKKCWYEPLTDPAEAELALRWTLSQPITAAIPPGVEDLFWMAVDIALRFEPITDEEEKRIEEMSHGLEPVFPV